MDAHVLFVARDSATLMCMCGRRQTAVEVSLAGNLDPLPCRGAKLRGELSEESWDRRRFVVSEQLGTSDWHRGRQDRVAEALRKPAVPLPPRITQVVVVCPRGRAFQDVCEQLPQEIEAVERNWDHALRDEELHDPLAALIAATIDAAVPSVKPEAGVLVLARGGGGWKDLASLEHTRVLGALDRARRRVPLIVGLAHTEDRFFAEELAVQRVDVPALVGVCIREHHSERAQAEQELRKARCETWVPRAEEASGGFSVAHVPTAASAPPPRPKNRHHDLVPLALLVVMAGLSIYGLGWMRRGDEVQSAASPADKADVAAEAEGAAVGVGQAGVAGGRQGAAPDSATLGEKAQRRKKIRDNKRRRKRGRRPTSPGARTRRTRGPAPGSPQPVSETETDPKQVERVAPTEARKQWIGAGGRVIIAAPPP